MIRSLNIISGVVAFLAVLGIMYGSQPCSSDGCMIRIVLVLAVPALIISIPVYYFTRKKLKAEDK
jgi:hypothetical protein